MAEGQETIPCVGGWMSAVLNIKSEHIDNTETFESEPSVQPISYNTETHEIEPAIQQIHYSTETVQSEATAQKIHINTLNAVTESHVQDIQHLVHVSGCNFKFAITIQCLEMNSQESIQFSVPYNVYVDVSKAVVLFDMLGYKMEDIDIGLSQEENATTNNNIKKETCVGVGKTVTNLVHVSQLDIEGSINKKRGRPRKRNISKVIVLDAGHKLKNKDGIPRKSNCVNMRSDSQLMSDVNTEQKIKKKVGRSRKHNSAHVSYPENKDTKQKTKNRSCTPNVLPLSHLLASAEFDTPDIHQTSISGDVTISNSADMLGVLGKSRRKTNSESTPIPQNEASSQVTLQCETQEDYNVDTSTDDEWPTLIELNNQTQHVPKTAIERLYKAKIPQKRRKSKKTYLCTICGKSFPYPNALKQHMATHMDSKPHVCSVCGSGFCREDIMKTHMRKHTGEKPNLCSLCGEAFVTKQLMEIHNVRKHSDQKPFVCSVCGAAWKLKRQLKFHMVSHSDNPKPFKCTVCTYSCKEAASLKIHMRRHTGERPYKCTECPFAAPQACRLLDHMRRHTGVKAYKCTQCVYCSASPGDLSRHVRRVHEK